MDDMRSRSTVVSHWLSAISLATLLVVICTGDELYESDPCTLHTGEEGVCRRPKDCPWLKPALRAHEITYQQLVRCGFDRDEPIICCRSALAKSSRIGVRGSVQACSTYDGLWSQLSFHIIGGEEVASRTVPFIGALGYLLDEADPKEDPADGTAYRWACGSSLITSRFLLTAAHCIGTPIGMPVMVRMGTPNLLAPAKPELVQDRKIKAVIVHPMYKKGQKYDDIALIEVSSPFQFDDELQPTCLNANPSDLGDAVVLLAAGWGFTDKGDSPHALLRTNLSTVPVDECTKSYASFKARIQDGIRPSQYCARGFLRADTNDGTHSDTCEGDSGGPLYYVGGSENAPKYFLLGITSFGSGCGSPNPSVYTRVSFYLDWIESHVWPTNPDEA
uniref:CLIP domain-containing serine protease n=1 Tax=Anopheles farauti TaxID=69004 RepID=A0A182Q048_9DIPT